MAILEHLHPNPINLLSGSPVLNVCLGKNFGVGSSLEDIQQSPDYLSPHSRITALATGIVAVDLAERGLHVTTVFSTGKTAGEAMPSEAAAQYTYAKRFFPELEEMYDSGQIILEEKSLDTAGNAKHTAEIIKERGLGEFALATLVTVGYHRSRAGLLFARNGLPVPRSNRLVSEKIVANRQVALQQREVPADILRRTRPLAWNASPQVAAERLKEALAYSLTAVCADGLLSSITSRTRG